MRVRRGQQLALTSQGSPPQRPASYIRTFAEEAASPEAGVVRAQEVLALTGTLQEQAQPLRCNAKVRQRRVLRPLTPIGVAFALLPSVAYELLASRYMDHGSFGTLDTRLYLVVYLISPTLSVVIGGALRRKRLAAISGALLGAATFLSVSHAGTPYEVVVTSGGAAAVAGCLMTSAFGAMFGAAGAAIRGALLLCRRRHSAKQRAQPDPAA